MVDYAHAVGDDGRIRVVYASELNRHSIREKYLCPNVDCRAVMTWRQGSGSDERAACFGAFTKDSSHIPGCPYSSDSLNGARRKLPNGDFDFAEVMRSIIERVSRAGNPGKAHGGHGEFESGSVPRSVAQLYSMLKGVPPDAVVSGQKVGYMLLDNRSLSMYGGKLFNGFRLVECFRYRPRPNDRKFYDKDSMTIWMEVSSQHAGTEPIVLSLGFEDTSLFWSYARILFDEPEYPIAIAGNWVRQGWKGGLPRHHAAIKRKKQIYRIR